MFLVYILKAVITQFSIKVIELFQKPLDLTGKKKVSNNSFMGSVSRKWQKRFYIKLNLKMGNY